MWVLSQYMLSLLPQLEYWKGKQLHLQQILSAVVWKLFFSRQNRQIFNLEIMLVCDRLTRLLNLNFFNEVWIATLVADSPLLCGLVDKSGSQLFSTLYINKILICFIITFPIWLPIMGGLSNGKVLQVAVF